MYSKYNTKYPYYHELQLASVNEYYKSNAEQLIDKRAEIDAKSNKFLSSEQNDLNNIYKMSNQRCRRTSYNSSFFDLEARLNDHSTYSDNFNVRMNRNSLFTQSLNNPFNKLDYRRSFWRPKITEASLDQRRKLNKRQQINISSNISTIPAIQSYSKSTDTLISAFQRKYLQ